MKKLLTIAIPVYNMEKYLSRCLESIVASTHLENLEILVVNDGSKDKSLEIALEYEKKYPYSVRVIDKPNGGWGTAINLTIKEAKGKYYKSLDSDDWFDTEELDKFIDEIRDVDADLILSTYTETNLNEYEHKFHVVRDSINKIISLDEYLVIAKDHQFPPIHARCYKTKKLQDNHVKVADRFYGDLSYNIYPMKYIQTVYNSDCNLYQYYQGREGQSVSMQGYHKNLDDFITVSKGLVNFFTENRDSFSPVCSKVLLNEILRFTRFTYKLLMIPAYCGKKAGSKTKLKDYDTFLKDNNRDLYIKTAKISKIGPLSWLTLWRQTGINLFKLKG